MFLFIPRSLCALKRVAAKADHPRFTADAESTTNVAAYVIHLRLSNLEITTAGARKRI